VGAAHTLTIDPTNPSRIYAGTNQGVYEIEVAPAPCTGDCDGDGTVTIAELIRLVNLALGTSGSMPCAAGDVNGDGAITVNEIVAAVNGALTGCADPAQACVDSAGQVTEVPCYCPSTPDFFNTCGVGACSCPPTGDPRHLNACDCGAGRCFNGSTCVARVEP
jgi:hypothetical protein